MRINEAAEKVGMTKRAIKYYEEQGLLTVSKDENGYRNYTEEDIRILKMYRCTGNSESASKISAHFNNRRSEHSA